MTWRIFGVIVGLWAATAGAQTAYAGKYEKDAAFQRFVKDVPRLKQAAIDHVKRRLGIMSPAPGAIEIAIIDCIPEKPEKIARYSGAAFETTTTDAAKKMVRITLRSEFIVSKRFDPLIEFKHEMVHAVMRQLVEPAAYERLPKWLREGLAVEAAGQTEERLIHAMLSADAFDDPGPVIEGLGTGRFSLERYGEAGAALEWLRRRDKDPAYERFVAAIVRDADIESALKDAYGLASAAYFAETRTATAQRCNELRPLVWDDYLSVKKADKERRYADVRKQADALLPKVKGGPLLDRVLYMHGKAARLQQEPALAKISLQRLLNECGGRSDFFDEGLYQLGTVLAATKDAKGAAAAFERCVRDVPDASVLDKCLLGWAGALLDLNEKERARAGLGLYEASFGDDAGLAALKARL